MVHPRTRRALPLMVLVSVGACSRQGFGPTLENGVDGPPGLVDRAWPVEAGDAARPVEAGADQHTVGDARRQEWAVDAKGLDASGKDQGPLKPDVGKPDAWSGKNLLVNGDCELGTQTPGNVVGWNAVSCASTWSCANKPNYINPPQAGNLLFFAGPCTPAELVQNVDVTAFAATIDQSQQKFRFTGWVSTWQTQTDSSRVVVEYRAPSASVTLASYDSGPLAVPLPWKQVSDTRLAPPGTRAIRVRLIAVRNEGTENDGYFDSLSLVPAP